MPSGMQTAYGTRGSRGCQTAPLDGVPSLTGGVAVTAPNLQPLVDHLSTITGQSRTVVVNPMRSAWWLVPFTALLCIEWALRRGRGLN